MRDDTRNRLLLAAAGTGILWGVQSAIRRQHAYDFRGKSVLVTGGSRGLGLELARQFALEGAHIAICARDGEELDVARTELANLGAPGFSISCDIRSKSQVDRTVESVLEKFGHIDVLVNSAGTITVGPMDTMQVEDYRDAMDVNFWGPLYSTLAVLPSMKQRGEGRIVNVASIGGKISVPHLLPYSASKFALVGFSRGLRHEVAKDGIVVTTVCPGLMRTGSPMNADFKGQHREEYAWFKIADSLPITAMSSERAAKQILDACRRGQAEVILSVPAKLAAKFDALFPELDAGLLSWANRMLPESGGIGTEKAKGRDSESDITRSALGSGSDQAATRNNQR